MKRAGIPELHVLQNRRDSINDGLRLIGNGHCRSPVTSGAESKHSDSNQNRRRFRESIFSPTILTTTTREHCNIDHQVFEPLVSVNIEQDESCCEISFCTPRAFSEDSALLRWSAPSITGKIGCPREFDLDDVIADHQTCLQLLDRRRRLVSATQPAVCTLRLNFRTKND